MSKERYVLNIKTLDVIREYGGLRDVKEHHPELIFGVTPTLAERLRDKMYAADYVRTKLMHITDNELPQSAEGQHPDDTPPQDTEEQHPNEVPPPPSEDDAPVGGTPPVDDWGAVPDKPKPTRRKPKKAGESDNGGTGGDTE